jgi:hypothetical protein
MAQVVYTTASREEVLGVLRRLPRVLAGTEADADRVAEGLQLRLGLTLLGRIQEAFVVKARGGTDEAGIAWTPLKRETVASRRPAPRKRWGERPRGLLTGKEDATWRRIFAVRLAWIQAKHGLDYKEAAAMAARQAWAEVKRQGARTKLAVYGGRQVEILRDTGELLASLGPGVDGRPPDGQILRMLPGRVVVGTNKKTWHHRGVPGRLPRRPLWPDDGRLPDSWWSALTGALASGLVRVLTLILQGRVT